MRDLWKMLRYTRYAWGELVTATALLVLNAYSFYLLPLKFGGLIDRCLIPLAKSEAAAPLKPHVLTLVLLLVALFLSGCLSRLILARVANKVTRILRDDLYRKLFRLEVALFDEMSAGDLLTRITSDTTEVSTGIYNHALVQIPVQLFKFIGLSVGLVTLLGPYAAFFLIVAGVFYTLGRKYTQAVTPLIVKYRGILSKIAGAVTENIRLNERLKQLGAVDARLEDFEQAQMEQHNVLMQYVTTDWRYFMAFYSLTNVLPPLTVACMGLYSLSVSLISAGTMIAVADYLKGFLVSLNWFMDALPKIAKSFASAQRVTAVLEAPEEPDDGMRPAPVAGPLTLRDVHFAYRQGQPVLNGLSFQVKPGETVALVGTTGSGKSTVLQLLLGFRRADAGVVMVGDRDVTKMHPEALRRHFALVQQDPAILAGTLYSNISLADPKITRDKARAALTAILGEEKDRDYFKTADDSSLLDYPVETRGKNLSAGEKQVLVFARALAHDPPILILDEATAMVDSATERLFNRAVGILQEGRTTVVVAHRLSTIQQCDRIFVLRDGVLEASGTHEELIAQKGTYLDFVTAAKT